MRSENGSIHGTWLIGNDEWPFPPVSAQAAPKNAAANLRRRCVTQGRELNRVHQNHFGIAQRSDLDDIDVRDRRTVARIDNYSVHFDRSRCRHKIAMTVRTQPIGGGLACFEVHAENTRIRTYRQGAVLAGLTTCERHECPRAVALWKGLRSPRRLSATSRWQNPNLKDFCHDGFEIVLGVPDSGTCAHHLNVARFGPALVAEAIPMRDRAFAHIGDDFHVGVRVERKTRIRSDLVVIPDAQLPPMRAVVVEIISKREMMARAQPAMVGAAKFL